MPESKSFSPSSTTSDPIDVPEPTFDNLELSPPNNNNRNTLELTDSSDFAPSPPSRNLVPKPNQFAIETTPDIPQTPGINTQPSEQNVEPVTYASTNFNQFQNTAQANAQFDSDSNIIPSTVMGAVSDRPSGMASTQTISTQPRTLAQTWPLVEELVEKSNFQDALFELSTFYRDGNFTDSESSQLLDWLDALAAKVIYSTEHHIISMPYIIQNGDTIGALARQWQIPAQLIYNINTGNNQSGPRHPNQNGPRSLRRGNRFPARHHDTVPGRFVRWPIPGQIINADTTGGHSHYRQIGPRPT